MRGMQGCLDQVFSCSSPGTVSIVDGTSLPFLCPSNMEDKASSVQIAQVSAEKGEAAPTVTQPTVVSRHKNPWQIRRAFGAHRFLL